MLYESIYIYEKDLIPRWLMLIGNSKAIILHVFYTMVQWNDIRYNEYGIHKLSLKLLKHDW